jgi:hypothetical protein
MDLGSHKEVFGDMMPGCPLLHAVNDDGLHPFLDLNAAFEAFGPKFYDPSHELIRSGHIVKLRQALQAKSAARSETMRIPDAGVSFQQLSTANVVLLQCANIVRPALFSQSFNFSDTSMDLSFGAKGQFNDPSVEEQQSDNTLLSASKDRANDRLSLFDLAIDNIVDSVDPCEVLFLQMAEQSNHLAPSYYWEALSQMQEMDGRLLKLMTIYRAVSRHVHTSEEEGRPGGGSGLDDGTSGSEEETGDDCVSVVGHRGTELPAVLTSTFVETLEVAVAQALGTCQYMPCIVLYNHMGLHQTLLTASPKIKRFSYQLVASHVHSHLPAHAIGMISFMTSRPGFYRNASSGSNTFVQPTPFYDARLPTVFTTPTNTSVPCMTMTEPLQHYFTMDSDGGDDLPFGSLANDNPADKVRYNKSRRSARWAGRLRLVDSRQDNADGRVSRRALQITNKYAVKPKPSFANVVRIHFDDKAGLGGGTLDDT